MSNRENLSNRKFTMQDEQRGDIFIYGLTGSGKTTISKYLSEYYKYRNFRNAGTIKQIIAERHNWSPDELEEQKRNDPKIRMEHHEISDFLTKEGTLNRCKMLATRRAFEFENIEDPERQICIGDTRDYEEATIYLEHEFHGIFLTRITGEFNAKHWTDVNIFQSDNFQKICNQFGGQITIIDNAIKSYLSDEFFQSLPDNVNVIRLGENCNAEELIESIDALIESL